MFRFNKRVAWMVVIVIAATAVIIMTIAGYDHYQQKQYEHRVARAIIKPVRVFQIGFSKCGTSTIAAFFVKNGIPTLHHDFGRLAMSMYENARSSMPLLSPYYEQFSVFTDMERMYDDPPISIGLILFKQLDMQYPGSKFILNTRDKTAWLKSRCAHPASKKNKTTLPEINAKILKISEKEVIANWSKEWDDHHYAVMEYFKDRPGDLLIFNIEKDSPDKIASFLKEYFILDSKFYRHVNKTSDRDTKADDEEMMVEIFNKSYKLDPNLRKKK